MIFQSRPGRCAGPSVEYRDGLLDDTQPLEESSDWIRERAEPDARQVGAVSVGYLHLFGYDTYAYLWSKIASAAKHKHSESPNFYLATRATASFYFNRLRPSIESLSVSVSAGAGSS